MQKNSKESLGKNVFLNIYDLNSLNCLLNFFGLGVFHSGVELMGREFAYGIFDGQPSCVRVLKPRITTNLKLRASIDMGETNLTQPKIHILINELIEKYSKMKYDLFSLNCHSFSQELCFKLTGKDIPRYVCRISAKLSFLRFCLPKNLIHGSDSKKKINRTSRISNKPKTKDNLTINRPLRVKLKRVLGSNTKVYAIDDIFQKKTLKNTGFSLKGVKITNNLSYSSKNNTFTSKKISFASDNNSPEKTSEKLESIVNIPFNC